MGDAVNSLADFYSGKKVLVTGHSGFKGGWLTLWLKLMGAEIIGFGLPPETQPNLYSSAEVASGIHSIWGDVRDLAAVKTALQQHNPEIIIHTAAQALVRRSYCEPVETYATNIMGTVHVLEAARTVPTVRSIVIVTSDKCYENREWDQAFVEGDAMGGHDPYSSSKGAAELVTAAYRRSFYSNDGSAAIASARAGNVIGGGDWSENRLIPDIVRGITSNTQIEIRSPDSVRPWQHVLEPLGGYLLLGQKLYQEGRQYAGAWNFAPTADDTIPVRVLVNQVRIIWGKGNILIKPDENGPHEATYLRLNCEKSLQHLGWHPRLRLAEAIKWTVDWYRASYEENLVSPRVMTERQIDAYMQVSKL